MLYAAKSYWPNVSTAELADVVRRIGMDTFGEARYAGSLLVADDDVLLCLFEACSPTDVQRASHHARIPCERVMRLVWLKPLDERNERCESA